MADLDLRNELCKRDTRYKDRLIEAVPLTLDNDIGRVIGDLAYDPRVTPEMMRRYLSAARLPYPVVWIEHDNDGFARRTDPPSQDKLLKNGWLLRANNDERTAFSILRFSRLMREDQPTAATVVFPFTYVVHTDTPMDYDEIARNANIRDLRFADVPRTARVAQQMMRMNAWSGIQMNGFLGEQDTMSTEMVDDPDAFDDTHSGVVARSHTGVSMRPPKPEHDVLRLHPLYGMSGIFIEHGYAEIVAQREGDPEDEVMNFIGENLTAQTNELRYVVAALALLNEAPVEYTPFRPSGRMISGKTTRPYLSTSVVRLNLPVSRRRVLDARKAIIQRTGTKKPLHTCRGHWRHSPTQPQANPDRWVPDVDDLGNPCFKTWINDHERGDASVGIRTASYKMTAKPGEADPPEK